MTVANRAQDPEQSELERYGIVTVPAAVYVWGGYRYTQARDALAAARRGDRK